MADTDIVQNRRTFTDWLWSWWIPVSSTLLRDTEKKILSCLKTTYRGFYVDIGPVVGSADKVWTISLNSDSERTPLLLLHGLGSGVAMWCLNLDSLASHRPVYAIDLLGFGRSSRPVFSSDDRKAETQLVESLEEWRKEMKVECLYILGHNIGGFLATSYAIKYPKRVAHLILADPWGFTEIPSDIIVKNSVPLWAQAVAYILSPFNPLFAIRAAGPFGQWLIEKARPDLVKKYSAFLGDDKNAIPQYLFQCNAQSPTGESAFHCLTAGSGWAKNPMLKRLDSLDPEIPITLIYGSRSWSDNSASDQIKEKRQKHSYINVQMISGAGNHVYADKSETFNKHVVEACLFSDEMTFS